MGVTTSPTTSIYSIVDTLQVEAPSPTRLTGTHTPNQNPPVLLAYLLVMAGQHPYHLNAGSSSSQPPTPNPFEQQPIQHPYHTYAGSSEQQPIQGPTQQQQPIRDSMSSSRRRPSSSSRRSRTQNQQQHQVPDLNQQQPNNMLTPEQTQFLLQNRINPENIVFYFGQGFGAKEIAGLYNLNLPEQFWTINNQPLPHADNEPTLNINNQPLPHAQNEPPQADYQLEPAQDFNMQPPPQVHL